MTTLKLSNLKDFKKIEQTLKQSFVPKGSDKQKMEISPFRDWRVVVVVFFVGLAGSFAFSTLLFIAVNSDSFFASTNQPAPGASLNRVGLAEVDKRLSESATRFEQIKKDGFSIVDPSR